MNTSEYLVCNPTSGRSATDENRVLSENSCLLIAWYWRLPFSGHSCDDSSITFPNWGWIQTLSTEEILIYGNLVLSYVCCQAIFYSHWSSVGETGLGIGFQTFDLFHPISHQVFRVLMFFSPHVSSGQQLWCSPSHSDQILASTLWSFWRDKHKSNCWRRTGRMFSPGIIGEKSFIKERCNGNGGQALCAEWWKSKWVNVENSFLFVVHCGW